MAGCRYTRPTYDRFFRNGVWSAGKGPTLVRASTRFRGAWRHFEPRLCALENTRRRSKQPRKTEMPLLAFQQFSSLLHPTFWHSLTGLKIDVLKLDDAEVPVTGAYGKGKSVVDRETGADVGLGCTVAFEGTAFEGRR
jgi:Ubiquitin-like modifier-activating enzyme ATG7 N-terminus